MAQAVQLTTQSTGQVAYKLRADASWIKLSTLTGSLSAKAPATVSVAVDALELVSAGQYSGTVTIFSGAAPPQFINVTATVRVDQSNIVATITPNSLVQSVVQSGGQWSIQIRLLRQRARATHVTAMKFYGADFTSTFPAGSGTAPPPAPRQPPLPPAAPPSPLPSTIFFYSGAWTMRGARPGIPLGSGSFR